MLICKHKILNDLLDSHDSFHEIDIYRAITDDWVTKRFMFNNFNYNKIYNKIISCFKWKNDFGIYSRNDMDFPREYWQLSCELYGRDYEGHYLVWFYTNNCNFYLSDLDKLNEIFLVHLFEIIDKTCHQNGFAFIKRPSNYFIQSVRNYFNFYLILHKYYPQITYKIYIVDLKSKLIEKVLHYFTNSIKENIILITSSELYKHINYHYIPKEYFGARDRILINNINKYKPLLNIAHYYDISLKSVNKFVKSI